MPRAVERKRSDDGALGCDVYRQVKDFPGFAAKRGKVKEGAAGATFRLAGRKWRAKQWHFLPRSARIAANPAYPRTCW